VPNHANVDDAFSIVDGIDYPIVSHPHAPEIARTSEFPSTRRPRLCREALRDSDDAIGRRMGQIF
jgi:hypothetical protein